jgi:mannose-1-phosphate guanylyltransferase
MTKQIYTITRAMHIVNLINLCRERLQRICGKQTQKTNLDTMEHDIVIRNWGHYRAFLHDPTVSFKVKELVVSPHSKLSMQRHTHRNEHWFILKGKCDIVTEYNNDIIKITKNQNDSYYIDKNVWHQCQNNYDEPCHILEVQFGEKCIEEDIERKNEY